ncbi:basic leucine zipper 23-like isoform X2 [Wolffia australiana]
MDSGEIEIANQEASSNVNDGDQGAGSCSMESFFDEILKDSHACTHAHSCNPPGPDASHTHTCFHVHTKIITNPAIDADSEEKTTNRKRPLGNREAVRKYREKMKARAASLEDEVAQLREINEQLLRRLQSQASLEAEVSLPIGTHVLDPCDMRFNDQVYCMRHGALEKSEMRHGGCDGAAVQCSADSSSGSEFLNSARASVLPKTSDSNGNRSRAKLRNARDF